MSNSFNRWDQGPARNRWAGNPWAERFHKWESRPVNQLKIVTWYYFQKSGELVKAIDKQVEDTAHDRFFYFGNKSDQYSTGGNYTESENRLKYQEIDMESDLGLLFRTVYSEMGGKDEYSHLIVAETIRNRTSRPVGSRENPDGTYKGIIEAAYDVADSGNPRYDEFLNPFAHSSNERERNALLRSVQQSIKAYFTNSNIAKGGMFYNSTNATIYDNNSQLEKITLDVVANGIAGVWRFKIQ